MIQRMRIKMEVKPIAAAVLLLCLAAALTPSSAQSAPSRFRQANLGGPKLSKPSDKLKAANNSSQPVSNIRERSLATSNSSNNSTGSARLEDFVEDELPADFYEMPAEQLDLGMNATGRAPVPILNVAVLQNGQLIDSAINVHPGTPLEMVIYLDDKSAKVYGLLASFLKVQDNTLRNREEIIIQNGCSIDTYIFGNFESNPDDKSLRAKFRAFKFPDSNFVRFVGTVNVCIKQCAEVNCGAGKRSKRSSQPNKDNRLVLTVSTVLRISNSAGESLQKVR